MKTHIAPRLALLFVLALVASPARIARADTFVITLRPGQAASIPFNFWCLDYARPFPTAVVTVGERAPDGVVAVLRAAAAKSALENDPYQTQQAIWRVTTGQFHDYANVGIVVAQEIYSNSLQIVVPPLPAGVPTLAEVIAQGVVSATVEGLTATQVTTPVVIPGEPFSGIGQIVLRNTSSQVRRFVVPDAIVFLPSDTTNAQRLVAEVRGKPDVPDTGRERAELPPEFFTLFAAGAALVGVGVAIPVAGRLRRRG